MPHLGEKAVGAAAEHRALGGKGGRVGAWQALGKGLAASGSKDVGGGGAGGGAALLPQVSLFAETATSLSQVTPDGPSLDSLRQALQAGRNRPAIAAAGPDTGAWLWEN